MDAQIELISEKTRVPIGWVFALLTFSGGGIIAAISTTLYISSVEGKAEAAMTLGKGAEIEAIASKQELQALHTYMESVDRRLSRIEGGLHLHRTEESR